MFTMSPAQCRAARALLDWTQPDLQREAGVGLSTVVQFEKGNAISAAKVDAMSAALDVAGVTFIPEDREGQGVRLKRVDAQK